MSDPRVPIAADATAALAARLRELLSQRVQAAATLSYEEAARAAGLQPPYRIHRVVLALECLMREDAAAGRALLAALVISRHRHGLPAPGFFALASELGRYQGPEQGEAARAFHQAELQRLQVEAH